MSDYSAQIATAQQVIAEKGGPITAEKFAEKLSEELERREGLAPRGRISVETASAIAARRGFYEVRAITRRQGALHTSILTPEGDKPWMDLAREGVLAKYGVQLIGASERAIARRQASPNVPFSSTLANSGEATGSTFALRSAFM